ncbi:MarR family transcriptional regulator [Haloarchaeobius salinus]|uniref:MarR family transcriptional regulator n=1 Tax=Haloarchaeobius salinus TaxID=1198298 RepID=UPI00210E44F7|nr:helix-turn-helix domain-containing protein [Haloarchaeobius salinus]
MSQRSPLSASESGAGLLDLPPSAKLVAKTLEYEGDATQSQLAESTLLPVRTVRDALTRLEAQGLVSSRISFRDARIRVYSLDIERERH